MIIDPRVDEYLTLLSDLADEIDVYILQPDRDGIEQITQILGNHSAVTVIHLVCHGKPGTLYLGSTCLNLNTLEAYHSNWQQWRHYLTAQSHLLLYGCQVAAGEEGGQLIRRLQEVTGADIAASQTLTGNPAGGGNWELEVTTGNFSIPVIFSPQAQANYAGVFAIIPVTTTVDENNGTGLVSLREAIIQANGTPEDDTIQLVAGQTYTLNGFTTAGENNAAQGDLDIINGSNITIEVVGGDTATLNGNNTDRIFEIFPLGSLTFSNLIIENGNVSGTGDNGRGGGIFNDGTLSISNSMIRNNLANHTASAEVGGGIYNSSDATATLTNILIENNTATGIPGGDGAGFYNALRATATLNNSTIRNNTATRNGGGLYNSTSAILTLNNSTINGNIAEDRGGGIRNRDGIVTLNNTTVTGNTANNNNFGGGIAQQSSSSSTLNLNHSTIAFNTGTGIDNDGFMGTSTVNLTHTIVANNTASPQIRNRVGTGGNGTPIIDGSGGYNLISDNSSFNVGGAGNLFNTNPLLSPLANNGGVTQTHALQGNSPALDTGNPNFTAPPNTDQRGTGFTRVFNGRIDIGAFESQPDLDIFGNGNLILDGDNTPSLTDGTDFGSIDVNAGTLISNFTIQNNAPNINANLTGTPLISILGSHASDFTVTTLPLATIPGGGNTTFTITFDPSGAGLRTAEISIPNTDPDENPYNFTIQGAGITIVPGIAPEIDVLQNNMSIPDEGAFNFGTTPLGNNLIRTFTVENTGDGNLTLGTPNLTGAGFSLLTGFGSTNLVSGGMTTFQILFNANTAGTFNGMISFPNNDTDENPYNFDLTAVVSSTPAPTPTPNPGATPAPTPGETPAPSGFTPIPTSDAFPLPPTVPEIEVFSGTTEIFDGSILPLDIDIIEVGQPRPFTIRNTGNGNLDLSNLKLPPGFRLVEDSFPSLLVPGETITFFLEIDPKFLGTLRGMVMFDTNDPDESVFQFTLEGLVKLPTLDVGAIDGFCDPIVIPLDLNIPGNVTTEVFIGGEENDTLIGTGAGDEIKGLAGNDVLIGWFGNDNIFGGVSGDQSIGDQLDRDLILGEDGNDWLSGGVGYDTLYGGRGQDVIYGGKDFDLVYGDEDNDTLLGDLGNDTLLGGTGDPNSPDTNGRDYVYGGLGNDLARGGKSHDAVVGNDGDDTLFGDIGEDTLCGGEGNDILVGGNGEILVLEGEGNGDHICGGAGDDLILGEEGNDKLCGDEGNDSLYGGKGNDILYGGLGNNYLSGDEGADIFVINLGGVDTIVGFATGVDQLGVVPGFPVEQLQITEGIEGGIIRSDNEILAVVMGVPGSQISFVDFVQLL